MKSAALQSVPSSVEVRTGYEPGLVGWVTELHGRYYAEAWKSGHAPAIETIVAREFAEVIDNYNPEKDLVLTALVDGEMAGSITVIDRGEESAQLRFFIVDPAYHGRGIGKQLLSMALDWCRERGIKKVFLWTVDSLPQSRALYEKTGFQIVERHTDDRYGVMLESLRMAMELG